MCGPGSFISDSHRGHRGVDIPCQEKIDLYYEKCDGQVPPQTPHTYSAAAKGAPPYSRRIQLHCRFRNRANEYFSESGMQWLNGSPKRQCALTVPAARKERNAVPWDVVKPGAHSWAGGRAVSLAVHVFRIIALVPLDAHTIRDGSHLPTAPLWLTGRSHPRRRLTSKPRPPAKGAAAIYMPPCLFCMEYR